MARYRRRGRTNYRKSNYRTSRRRTKGKSIRKIYVSRGGIRL